MTLPKRATLISIHDVMPHTLSRVERLLECSLNDIAPANVLLLVVPGLDWSSSQIKTLQTWQQVGYELAGHGWQHRIRRCSSAYHRLHSLLISRDAAEHLSLSGTELNALIEANAAWFPANGLVPPQVYVPPAWAVGELDLTLLRDCGFRCLETTTGLVDLHSGTRRRLPLVGFEADTRLRAGFLRLWNRLNASMANEARPLRLSIHPFDDEYRIADQMTRLIREAQPVHWSTLLSEPAQQSSLT